MNIKITGPHHVSEEEEVDISTLNDGPPFSTVSVLDSPETRKRKEDDYKEKRSMFKK